MISLEQSLAAVRPYHLHDAESMADSWLPGDPENDPETWWRSTWLPLGCFDAHILFADTASSDGIHASLGHSALMEHGTIASSISIAVRYWTQCLDAGVAKWEPDRLYWTVPVYTTDPIWPPWPEGGAPPL